MASLMPNGKQQFLSTTGTPLVGGKLYTYAAGTVTPKNTFSDAAGVVPNTNPVVFDARGEALIFWAGTYKIVLQDATGNIIYTVDNYVTDAAANGITAATLAAVSGSSLVGFLPTGTGAAATTVQSALDQFNQKSTGTFFADQGGKVNRVADRLFVGEAIISDGKLTNTVNSWLEVMRPNSVRAGQMAVTSTIGQIAIVGGSRTSESAGVGSQGCIGVSGYSNNNNATQIQSSYAGYFESRRQATTGITQGIEIDIVNLGSTEISTPALPAPAGLSNALWLASGGGVAGATTASLALGIINNGAAFNKGILFQSNAIAGTDGVTGLGTAISLAKGHIIGWYNNSGGNTSYVYSGVLNTSNGNGLVFTDTGPKFVATADGGTLMSASVIANAANNINLLPAVAGSTPAIQPVGADANMNLLLSPKGTGVLAVSYGSTTATTPSAFSATRRLTFMDGNNILWYIPISTVAW